MIAKSTSNLWTSVTGRLSTLVQFIQSVKILSYDISVWQNTKCTCKNYLKNNFCKYSYRLEALNFESIAMEEPITARIKRGRPKANAPVKTAK